VWQQSERCHMSPLKKQVMPCCSATSLPPPARQSSCLRFCLQHDFRQPARSTRTMPDRPGKKKGSDSWHLPYPPNDRIQGRAACSAVHVCTRAVLPVPTQAEQVHGLLPPPTPGDRRKDEPWWCVVLVQLLPKHTTKISPRQPAAGAQLCRQCSHCQFTNRRV